MLTSALSSWKGEEVPPVAYPEIEPVKWHEVNHAMLRDQTVLCYGALSVERDNRDFDKLLLFDQIFTGGVLGSMASRLFDLREETGLFYTIGGSLISQVDDEPGLIVIKTIVSNDRLKEAEVAIERVINTAIDDVSDEEFTDAQQAIINSLVNSFSTIQNTAATLLQVDKYNLPGDYFDKRAAQLATVTKSEMQDVIKNYLTTDRFVLVRVGRSSRV
jgi:predicted Zn-dependent peptidase